MALVVFSSTLLVYTLACNCMAVVARVVGMVGLDLVAFPVDFLVILVGYRFQGTYNFALAQKEVFI